MLAWSAVSITCHHNLRIVEVAALLGPASIIAGLLGLCAAGPLVDRIMTRTGAPARLRLLALMPAAPAAILMLATILAYPALATMLFLVLHGSVSNERRGFAISLCGLTNARIGSTGGPLLVAWLAGRVFHDAGAIADVLSLMLLIAMLAGIALFVTACRRSADAGLAAEPELALTQAAVRG